MTQPVTLAITGASGACYGLRLLECLLAAQVPVALLVSRAAQLVIALASDCALPGPTAAQQRVLHQRFGVGEEPLRGDGHAQSAAPIAWAPGAPHSRVVCAA